MGAEFLDPEILVSEKFGPETTQDVTLVALQEIITVSPAVTMDALVEMVSEGGRPPPLHVFEVSDQEDHVGPGHDDVRVCVIDPLCPTGQEIVWV